MKKIIKLTLLIVVLGVFMFSSNSTVEKVREYTLDKGEYLYEKAINKTSDLAKNDDLKKGIESLK